MIGGKKARDGAGTGYGWFLGWCWVVMRESWNEKRFVELVLYIGDSGALSLFTFGCQFLLCLLLSGSPIFFLLAFFVLLGPFLGSGPSGGRRPVVGMSSYVARNSV